MVAANKGEPLPANRMVAANKGEPLPTNRMVAKHLCQLIVLKKLV
jgi:hypothetical protein